MQLYSLPTKHRTCADQLLHKVGGHSYVYSDTEELSTLCLTHRNHRLNDSDLMIDVWEYKIYTQSTQELGGHEVGLALSLSSQSKYLTASLSHQQSLFKLSRPLPILVRVCVCVCVCVCTVRNFEVSSLFVYEKIQHVEHSVT